MVAGEKSSLTTIVNFLISNTAGSFPKHLYIIIIPAPVPAELTFRMTIIIHLSAIFANPQTRFFACHHRRVSQPEDGLHTPHPPHQLWGLSAG